MASSSSTTPSSMKKYDVFLSARGVEVREDTGIRRFTLHLYDVLRQKKLSIFAADSLGGLNEREIEGSRISVFIFTKRFAFSKCCLEELVKIVECREKYNQIVIPVYCGIEPSQVRKQTGPFEAAFKEYEANFLDKRSLPKWRVALTEASNLPGYNLSEFESEDKINQITRDFVDGILMELKRMDIEDIIERYVVHKDGNAFHDDIVNFKNRYSGHEDEEAINDAFANCKKRYSGHKDEEALNDAFANFIKHTSLNIGEQYSSSSSITPSFSKTNDVYLSFHKYSHHNFTSHLYDVLRENKISTSKEFWSALDQIEKSRISLIIFSKDYADSRWRLDELVKILECREKYNQIVIPVFYLIKPSQLRDQTGPFAALKVYEENFLNKRSLAKWRVALTKASNLPGYNLLEFNSEAELTEVIVGDISKKLGKEAKPGPPGIGESQSRDEDEEEAKPERRSIVDILDRYRVHKDEEALHVDIVNFIKRNSCHKDDGDEEDSGDGDKEAINDDNENIREKDSGDEDEEAIDVGNENISEKDSGDEDKEALHDDKVDYREKDSGHRDEEAFHDDKVDNREQDSGQKDEDEDELVNCIINIIKGYSGHIDEDELHLDIGTIIYRICAQEDKDELQNDILDIMKRYSREVEEKAIHDVFLSCSDERSPYSFTTHLYEVLLGNKISTVIDDSRLQRGDEISPALLNAIEKSRISLIIFSKDYAGSRLCLDKLVRILECREKDKQIVIPVFYDIDPSDVRDQTGPLAEAFKKHEASFDETSSVPKWRVALTEASNLPGYNLSEFDSEAELTEVVVVDIKKKLVKGREAGDNKDTREQNRGDGGGGNGGGGGGGDGGGGGGDGGGDGGGGGGDGRGDGGDGRGNGGGGGGGDGGDGRGDGGGDGPKQSGSSSPQTLQQTGSNGLQQSGSSSPQTLLM